MNPIELTDEQTFMLHRTAIETRSYSRDELIEALLDCLEDKFRQKQIFLAASKDAGFAFKFNEGIAIAPKGEDEEIEFDEEDDALQDILDSSHFELDMDAIVLGKDE